MGMEWKACLVLMFFMLTACEPKTYEDCILSEIDKAQNNWSANLVRAACRSKFPETVSVQNEDGTFSQVPKSTIKPYP